MMMVHAPLTVSRPLVVKARLVLVRVPAHVTVVKEVSAAANVTGPLTVSGAAHKATGVQTGVPPPPLRVSAAPLVNRPVLTAAPPLGLITTNEENVPPFTGPVDTAPEDVVRVRVVEPPNVTDARVMAAFPVLIAQVPETVSAPDVLRAKPVLLNPPAQVMVATDRAVAKFTARLTVSGAFQLATGVHVGTAAPALNVSDAALLKRPVLIEAEPVGHHHTGDEPTTIDGAGRDRAGPSDEGQRAGGSENGARQRRRAATAAERARARDGGSTGCGDASGRASDGRGGQ